MRNTFCRPVPAALAASILLPIAAAAQESRPASVNPNRLTLLRTAETVLDGARRMTLADAQQLAQASSDPLKRLGELQVEAARQHRLGVKSMYFPQRQHTIPEPSPE